MKTRVVLLGCLSMMTLLSVQCLANNGDSSAVRRTVADPGNAGLKLPAGFKAQAIAENLGAARHIAVTPLGDVYVKIQTSKPGKAIAVIHGNDVKTFGTYRGTGMVIKGKYLYTSSDEDVYRYALNDKFEVINPEQPEKIVTGLINRHQHEAKALTLDNDGNIYVNIGAYSNSCQVQDRAKGSKGMEGCPIRDSAAGIWQFRADKQNQTYGDGSRYATGLRNVVGLDWNTTDNQLFVMQHGRDGLFDMFPEYYNLQQGNELPAECMYALKKGDDAGWPYIYYDGQQQKKILSPEYGGDGKKTGGENAIDPVVAFPAHMAPNGLLFYTGSQFPAKYKNGAFVAFHGSWNRQKGQKGYFVAFVPFKDGKPSGKWEVFADDFAGVPDIQSPGQAKHRPCGLAQGPDGSLYVTDDVKGTVYKITYSGK
ncbi:MULTISPECIES: PQQ-dependent sugar dehydrogenase [Chitinophaga]|uniref:PQQ-dependent sugar dehydrogenase n=1 Tax=Chitinophaga TaxID=79328 RepID=UPI000DB983C0|nr:PQQ-dependent sugar dehydrogenase [Chitinophaga ginsengisegetis]MDR6565162.1 glucose/arabinose dehydrogenase [Chitinophaga ginsengisegetis]MDR6644889.1 glucose/arabinose dehydrogenase [Chitinophaga ginsengisegetis]MDR6652519.1 glucose/arabinose dehydrogenase [Chitinophaga ginsengisegetis]